MTRTDYFNDREALIRTHFENYKKENTKPEYSAVCELYNLYNDAMSWFYAEERSESEALEQWREKLNLAGIKAHKIYDRLKEKGINVVYDKHLIENRKEYCKCGPEKLEFHLHHDSVNNLLNFCIVGTADIKMLNKMRKKLN